MHPGKYAASTPDRPAVVMSGGSETLTYARLEERSIRLSRVLHDPSGGPPNTTREAPLRRVGQRRGRELHLRRYENHEQLPATASTEQLADNRVGYDLRYSSGTTGRPALRPFLDAYAVVAHQLVDLGTSEFAGPSSERPSEERRRAEPSSAVT